MKRATYIILILFTACLSVRDGYAQAFQLSQFYSAPTFLNPAFAGAGVCARLTTDYRLQWPSIPGAFRTYLLALDHDYPRKKSGLGLLLVNDRAGSGNLRSTSVHGQYSYHLVISRAWMFNAGFEAGLAFRNYDFHKYVFGDMIATGNPSSFEQPDYDQRLYPDIGSGVMCYSETMWIGFSAKHLNRPNQALIEDKSHLPVLYSLHAGRKIPIERRGEGGKTTTFVTPAINYRAERKFDQLDLGFYYTYSEFSLGLWYRGIPLFKAYKRGYQNNDMIALMAGVTVDRFKFGYSYDITISRLAGSTAGSHEISLSYQLCKRTPKSSIPCPKF